MVTTKGGAESRPVPDSVVEPMGIPRKESNVSAESHSIVYLLRNSYCRVYKRVNAWQPLLPSPPPPSIWE